MARFNCGNKPAGPRVCPRDEGDAEAWGRPLPFRFLPLADAPKFAAEFFAHDTGVIAYTTQGRWLGILEFQPEYNDLLKEFRRHIDPSSGSECGMGVKLLIGAAASGKTTRCLEALGDESLLEPGWIILPDRNQVSSVRRIIAAQGGSLGTNIGTFGDLFRAILALSGEILPIASPAVIHRLVCVAIEDLVGQGGSSYFSPIAAKPGFVNAIEDRIAEFKRAQITPDEVIAAAKEQDDALREIGFIYRAYQEKLRSLGWLDREELNWRTSRALEEDPALASTWKILIIDGFDSFHRSQLKPVQLLGERMPEVMITLPGEVERVRPAHRRFIRSKERILEIIPGAVIESLESPPHLAPSIAHLESQVFELEVQALAVNEGMTMLEARSPSEEAREALRWLKSRTIRDGVPLHRCALVTPDPERYRPLLKEAAREFGIPLRFTHGDPLSRAPSIAALLGLLELTISDWPRRTVLDILNSPYFDLTSFGLKPEDSFALDEVSLFAQVTRGLDLWVDGLTRLKDVNGIRRRLRDEGLRWPNLPSGDRAGILLESLLDMNERMRPPEGRTMRLWIDWLEDLLDELDYFSRCNTPHDRAAALELRETFRALILGEEIAGEEILGYEEFFSELRRLVENVFFTARINWRQPAVLVLRVLEARGMRFQAVAVLGLSEGIFPVVEREDPFLNDAIRESMGLDPRLGRDQGGLFYQAITRADSYLLLTRPYLAEDGSSWEPSPFWTAVDGLFVDVVKTVRPDEPRALEDAASAEELLFWAVRKRKFPAWAEELTPRWKMLQSASDVLRARQARISGGSFEGDLHSIQERFSQIYGKGHVWSASRIESYAQCPMFFLTSSVMMLDPRDPPEPGYDPAQLGLILHAILEKVYPAASDPTSTDSVLRVLADIAEESFSHAPEEYGFQPTALWSWECEELLETLEKTITALGEVSQGWIPYAYEQKFGIGGSSPVEIELEGETVLARGIIDRVDRNRDGELRIIDYKTGSSHLGRGDLIRGRRLQLVIYALGARDALNLGEPVEGFYWMIRAAKAGSLKLSTFKHTRNGDTWLGPEGALDVARMHIQKVVQRVRAGQFMPAAPDGGCPSYCPAVDWCWRYQAGWR